MSDRHLRFHSIRNKLLGMSQEEILGLVGFESVKPGWGWNQIVQIEEVPVFLKGIPLTDLESAHPDSTRNLYSLPNSYHYGVGSAGFGAFRELRAHQKANQFVLNHQCPHFPLLYDHRIIERPSQVKQNLQKHPDSYFEYWGNQPSIRNYVEARHHANQEILLILEFFPHNLYDWLPKNQIQTPGCLAQLESACQFLEQQGILHLDAHFMNLLTDGELFVLGDFGLWLDPDFELAPEEKEFLSRHDSYDIREIYLSLARVAYHLSLGLKPGERPAKIGEKDFSLLFENLDSEEFLRQKGIHPNLAESILRHEQDILSMLRFFGDLREDPAKKTSYPDYF